MGKLLFVHIERKNCRSMNLAIKTRFIPDRRIQQHLYYYEKQFYTKQNDARRPLAKRRKKMRVNPYTGVLENCYDEYREDYCTDNNPT